MATKTWTGAGADNNWGTAGNWSPSAPVTGDDIIFDGVAANGKKNCTLNVGVSMLSITFTAGYTNAVNPLTEGKFTFSAGLIITGTLTLGVNTTYATSGTPTTYTLTVATTTIISNGKSLPVNILLSTNGATLTINGNAEIQGNYSGTTGGHFIRSSAGFQYDLRIGGNISLGAVTNNATDYVTFKAYGANKTFTAVTSAVNQRIVFASGSSYTNPANHGCSGTSFYTVEAGGQFNATTAFSMTNGGTLTLSGFNSTTGSDFMSINGQGAYILLNDTVIKGFISTPAIAGTITGAFKILLEGNFTTGGGATLAISNLEFSGSTPSTVSAVTTTNLQITNLSFNKTGGGSVNFAPLAATSGLFTLTIPANITHTWTHTSGTITQSSASRIVIACANAVSQLTYSESGSLSTPFTFSALSLNGGVLSLNSTLRAIRLYLTLGVLSTTITSSGTLGFIVDILSIINSAAALRFITLKAGCTYSINTQLYITSLSASQITLASNVASSYAYFNLDNNASQLVEYVTATDIDSSGTLGIVPYSKQLIYDLQGVLTRTINWSVGVQPPPVLPSRTVAYTFVN